MPNHLPDSPEEWFVLLDQLYKETDDSLSELPCFAHCPQCLCERKENEKIYFLPFEMEFIQRRTGADLRGTGAFWTLDIPLSEEGDGSRTVPIGFKSKLHTCPFLADNNCCTIHKDRPFDCRSFPFIPIFHDERVSFELEEYCPLVRVLGRSFLKGFTELYQRLWGALLLRLPQSWKRLYWHSNELIPEMNDPDERPRRLDLRGRFLRVDTIQRRSGRGDASSSNDD